MQAALYHIVLDPKSLPQHKSAAVVAWERLEDRKRVLRGRGKAQARSLRAIKKREPPEKVEEGIKEVA
jgi:hypothetical protein